MKKLIIGGITPFTTIDMPGKNSAVIFCQKCPWQCSYCYNTHLTKACPDSPIDWDIILKWLEPRKGFLEAVIFSGGEPTIQDSLYKAMTDVKSMGFEVGIHTGGCYPEKLFTLLPLIDWIGLDIKAPCNAYEKITKVADSGKAAWKSLKLIIQENKSYEVRTTYHPSLLTEQDMITIATELSLLKVNKWIIQTFKPQGCKEEGLITNKNLRPINTFVHILEEIFLKRDRADLKIDNTNEINNSAILIR